MKNLLLLFLFCSGLAFEAVAQTESTLYFMNSIPQVVDANPAIMPRYKISIGLPFISSVGAIYSNNGFTYNDLMTKTNGVVQANLSQWTQGLAEKNYVTAVAQTDLLRFGMRINPKMYLMFSSTVRGYNRSMIEKGLASVLVDGTAPIVGSYSNTAPQEEAISFVETNIGLAYQANEKLTIGGRIKHLRGLTNVTTESSSMIVQVDQNYMINATGEATVRTSGIYSLSKSGYNAADHIGDYLQNSGWGVDLGVTYKFMDKLTMGASLTDLGYIKWTNDTYSYTMDPAKAKYTFSGLDVTKILDNNTSYINSQWDSIKSKFAMKEAPSGSYTSMLPGKFYLSANYELPKNFSVGALFFTEKFKGRYAAGMTAAVNKTVKKWLTGSLTYTVSNRSYNNLGLGVSFNVEPVQFYIVGDNLLRAPVSLLADQNLNSYLNSSQLLTVRAGLNIVIGWDKGLTKKEELQDKSANPTKGKQNKSYGRTTTKKSTSKSKKTATPKPKKSKVGR